MIDAIALGKLLAEEVTNPAGPCLYPGKFHPPHRGHMKAAVNLASRDYITEVVIIVSEKISPETGNITPEQAIAIWRIYLDAQTNIKIQLRVSEHSSPVKDMIAYIAKAPKDSTIYVAVGEDEKDDEDYAQSLQKMFGNRIKTITVQEKDGEVSAPHVRTLVQQRDYEKFKETVPEAAYNRGAAPKIWDMLTRVIPQQQEQQPEEQPQQPTSDQGQGIN